MQLYPSGRKERHPGVGDTFPFPWIPDQAGNDNGFAIVLCFNSAKSTVIPAKAGIYTLH
ncbi:MAG: hypothetical protein GY839_19185 [candidate division Zixibacteria bacterium]|nr:hypothetical protein [candidate division Zixibacteria bacterium]